MRVGIGEERWEEWMGEGREGGDRGWGGKVRAVDWGRREKVRIEEREGEDRGLGRWMGKGKEGERT